MPPTALSRQPSAPANSIGVLLNASAQRGRHYLQAYELGAHIPQTPRGLVVGRLGGRLARPPPDPVLARAALDVRRRREVDRRPRATSRRQEERAGDLDAEREQGGRVAVAAQRG